MNRTTAKADLHTYDLTDAEWRKSSYSAGEGQCVEITGLPGGIALRDSKDKQLPALRYTDRGWNAFRQALINGPM
ncbi:DUF397 domain-containing protein [Streptomyces sp. NBC_00876]|uniref:DUF397 domain-containing protein n=1 Tax=Streptomyces sp. NBC_00876 TaxID=2975853 RepID=UPI0038640B0B|nr:DUF397 domain-containing protein [Streptomyces sp. NBC_00876]